MYYTTILCYITLARDNDTSATVVNVKALLPIVWQLGATTVPAPDDPSLPSGSVEATLLIQKQHVTGSVVMWWAVKNINGLYYTQLLYLYYAVLYYIMLLCCTTLYYTTLYCSMLHYTVLHCTALHYTQLCYTTLYCSMLHYTVLHCTALYSTMLYYSTILYYCIV